MPEPKPWAADRLAAAQGLAGEWAHKKGKRFKGGAMSSGDEEFWSTLPVKVLHPVRVPIIEALRWIGEPLSAIALVDVLDGFLSMWEAAHHLRVLDALDVAESSQADTDSRTSREDLFGVPYCLRDRNSSKGA